MVSPFHGLCEFLCECLCECLCEFLRLLLQMPFQLHPLKVKNSEHGGPYASRTRIGWVVNGPLGRYHQGSHATSCFVKADTELQRMVEDFYNFDFNESVADNRTELSQDERRFMASVEGSTFIFYFFICILLGRIFTVAQREKGTRGLQRPLRRCPTSPTPHLHTKDSHSTGITLLLYE